MPEPLLRTRGGRTFWTCGRCGTEREGNFPGSYVRVAEEAIAIVCTRRCETAAKEAVRVAFRNSRSHFTTAPESGAESKERQQP